MAFLTQSNQPLLIISLLGLSAYAFYATWGISLWDNTLTYMLDIRGVGKYWQGADVPLIPGTKEPLRLHFTGIPPVDYWYTIMVLFFWEAVDGSHPATSLTGVYFLGQLVGVWTLVYVEGCRVGNRGLLVAKTLLWTLLMQNLTLACFGPIYFSIHLETSPTARPTTEKTKEETPSVLATATRSLKYLPFSIVLGYVIPSIFLGLSAPGAVSYASQQAAIAVWTPFPVWVCLAQFLFTWCDANLSSGTAKSAVESQKDYLQALRAVYAFALAGSAAVHIGTIATTVSTVLFPAIFASGYRSEFAPANLLFPKNEKVGSIGAGVLNFMQWDQWIGYTALLLWVLRLLQGNEKLAAKGFFGWISRTLEIFAAIVLLGPGGAAVVFIWKKDEAEALAEGRIMKPKYTNGKVR